MSQKTTDQPENRGSAATHLLGLFPEHKCGLFLKHNVHRDYYQSAADWCKEQDERGEGGMYEWESDEAKARAIATDEIWTLQWYPNTPVGFNAVASPTLPELLEWASHVCD